MNGIIYKATNLINNMIYIGKTTNLERRKLEHKKGSFNKKSNKSYNTYFHRAIRKYGIDNFVWSIEKDYITTEDELNKLEKEIILKYNSTDPKIGYNMTFGGNGLIPVVEVRNKISKSLKRLFEDPVRRERLRISSTVYNNKPEVKKESSERMKGKCIGEKSPWFGKHHTISAKRKLSELAKKQFSSSETRENSSIYRGGKLFDVFDKKSGNYIGSWINQHACALELNCNVSHINSCLKKKRNYHHGYIFKYKE